MKEIYLKNKRLLLPLEVVTPLCMVLAPLSYVTAGLLGIMRELCNPSSNCRNKKHPIDCGS